VTVVQVAHSPCTCLPTEELDLNQDVSRAEAIPIRLDQFLKFAGLAATGGHAKISIQNGEVQVNGEIETRRRRKLSTGDVVAVGGHEFSVTDYVGG
jgi:ribosome-associated protein